MEVPCWRGSFTKLIDDPTIKRVGIFANHDGFLRYYKCDAVFTIQRLNFIVKTWLLFPKIVGWNTDYDQAPFSITIPQLLQGAKLTNEAAFGRRVNDKYWLPFKPS